jgi:PAS domain S-box-containing protein
MHAQSTREARALAEIVQQINQSLETDRVFTLIARHAVELLGASGSWLGMLDEDHFTVVATFGAVRMQAGERVTVNSTFCGPCVRSLQPVRTLDLTRLTGDESWSARLEPTGRHNAVAVPLLVGDRPIGAITVFGNEARDFDQHDEALLLALANHAAVAIENARLYRACVRTMRHANILATAARHLAQNTSPRAMYADIARLARASLGADGTAIYLADPSATTGEMVFVDGAAAAATTLAAQDFWRTAGGQVVRTGVAEFRSDLHQFRDEPLVEHLIRANIASVALLPLMIEGEPRGLLALRFITPRTFDAEQRHLLRDFSTHAAIAVRNALQIENLERRAGRLAAVATVQQAISAASSLDHVYAEIYRAVTSVIDAPCFALLSLDQEGGALVPEYVINDGQPVATASLPRLALDDGATSQVLRSGYPNVVARSRLGWTGHYYELKGVGEIAVILSAPIVHDEHVLGVLQAQSYRHDAYDWDDVDVITLIARQAGTAIAKARAYETERQAREEAEAAFAIARISLGAASLEEAAPAMLGALDEAAPGGAVTLAVMPHGQQTIRFVAARGTAAHLAGTTRPLAGESNIAVDTHAFAAFPGGPGGAIPLLSRGRIIGAIGLARHPDADPASTRAYAVLSRLAAPVSLALDTLLMREEEEEKRVRERTLATALEAMEQPVFVCSTRSIIRHANGAAIREFGYSLTEFIGMHERQLGVRPPGQPLPAEIRRAMAAQGVWIGEMVQRRKDGSEFPAWVTMSAIRDDEGRTVGVVVIVRNLTEERRIAEQLRQSERLVALGELVAGVAHEVNNPLTGISAFAQLLQEDTLTDEQRESAQMIKREADRAVTVVRDLLTFARKSGPRSVPTDINALIEQTLRLRTYGLRTAGVHVDLQLAPDLRQMHGDDRQIQQVLLNLIVNAEHAMASVPDRRLVIRTANANDRVVVEVADSGIGMTPEVQKRIFEPFFTTKGEGNGTGLGLSVSYGIVQAHGGTLTVHSAPGQGATFRISLPASAEEHDTMARRVG